MQSREGIDEGENEGGEWGVQLFRTMGRAGREKEDGEVERETQK